MLLIFQEEKLRTRNPYRALGFGFCLAGAIFAPVSYFIVPSVPLTAIGLSAIMIGLTAIALASSRPALSPESCEVMLRTGMENMSALIEELGLRSKAIYLPSSMREGKAQAVIPLVDNGNLTQVKGKIPGRLIVRYGSNPEDMAIAVSTPGSINIGMLESRPGPTASEIEAAASYVLSGLLDLADSVTVNLSNGRVNAEVNGSRIRYEDIWFYRCLGSPLASIIAAISSEALEKPVRILEEKQERGKSRVVIEVLS